MAAGRLYVTSRSGSTTLLTPKPQKLEVRAMNKLGEQTEATSTFSAGETFLRANAHLYCIAED